jgi:hypothetical protein
MTELEAAKEKIAAAEAWIERLEESMRAACNLLHKLTLDLDSNRRMFDDLAEIVHDTRTMLHKTLEEEHE